MKNPKNAKPIVTLSKGGTNERIVDLSKVHIPDLWHIAQGMKEAGRPESAEAVLEVWRLAHDLQKYICGWK